MADETITKTLLVAGLLSVVCSAFVATSAVTLRPLQQKNKTLDRKMNILQASGTFEKGKPIDDQFKKFEMRVVDLATGEFNDDIDAATFDQRKAAKSSENGVPIEGEDDVAGIKRRSRYALVYIAKDASGKLSQLILPVHGKGLWSTMYGYMALDKDLTTIDGFAFYEHGETPGLGGEVDNPKWKAQWIGKKAFDKDGVPRIEVIKGKVNASAPNQEYQVDGLAGATITARGVGALLDYWLGENGFQPFLEKMKSEGSK